MSRQNTKAAIVLSVGLSTIIAVILDKFTKERVMGAVADALASVGAKIAKIKDEQNRRVAELEAQLVAKDALDDEDRAAIASLHGGLDDLDALVPDGGASLAPTVTPAPEVVEQVDTSGDITTPVTGDTAGYIREGEPIPDPTGDVEEDTSVSDGHEHTPEGDAVADDGSDEAPASDEPAVSEPVADEPAADPAPADEPAVDTTTPVDPAPVADPAPADEAPVADVPDSDPVVSDPAPADVPVSDAPAPEAPAVDVPDAAPADEAPSSDPATDVSDPNADGTGTSQ